MQGFSAVQISLAAVVIGIVFGAGLLYWGNRFKNMRRTTIILYGILGGGVLVGGGPGRQPRRPDCRSSCPSGAVAAAGVGLFVLAGATPAALGLLADISERFPADRGAIMGLYTSSSPSARSPAASIGGFAADWRRHRRHAGRHGRAAAHRARSRSPSCAARSTTSAASARRPRSTTRPPA